MTFGCPEPPPLNLFSHIRTQAFWGAGGSVRLAPIRHWTTVPISHCMSHDPVTCPNHADLCPPHPDHHRYISSFVSAPVSQAFVVVLLCCNVFLSLVHSLHDFECLHCLSLWFCFFHYFDYLFFTFNNKVCLCIHRLKITWHLCLTCCWIGPKMLIHFL